MAGGAAARVSRGPNTERRRGEVVT